MQKRNFFEVAANLMTKEGVIEDEFDVTGKKIAFQLRSLDETQRIFVEKVISDAMFYGKLGRLTEGSKITETIAETAIPDYSESRKMNIYK